MTEKRPTDLDWKPDLHTRLAQRAALLTRATRGAAAAAVAAVMGLFLGLTPQWHALASLAAAGVAAAWPLRPGLRAAFAAIAQQAGLAYQTHIEHAGRDDPHGLLAAASVQARLSIRGVTPPRQGAWWLPLAALALATWLLASVIGGPGAWFPPQQPGLPESAAPPPTPPPVTAPEPDFAEAEPEPDEVTPPDAAEAPPQPPADPGPGDGRDDAPPEGDAEGVEREALERFLESLRERPSLSEAERAAAEAERDAERDAGDADLEGAEVRDDPDASLDDGQRTPAERRDDLDADTTLDTPERGGEGEPTDEEARDDQDPASGADPGDDAAGDPDQLEEGLGEDAFDAAGDPGADPGRDDEQPGESGMGGDEPELDAGEGDDAGVGIGRPDPGHDQVPDPGGDLEALPGILGPGPETLGGRVRLPGRGSDIELAPDAAARFERAVEQAVTDGSVPVEYQEVIRNYFR